MSATTTTTKHSDHQDHQANNSNNLLKIELASDCIEPSYEARLEFELFMTNFRETFHGQKPDFIIWAPGRVNLIGEHIDYHGFSVLPIAIKQRIWMGISMNDQDNAKDNEKSSICLANTCKVAERATWQGKHSLEYGKNLSAEHHWYNYFLCAYQGVLASELLDIDSDKILDFYREKHSTSTFEQACLDELPNLKLLVHSDLPAASGLSSSSALVCASALATILTVKNAHKKTNGQSVTIDRLKVANNCSYYEHLIGTQGGGMDQAIIMNAQRNFAKLVQFKPEFKCDNVKLPSDIVWLVSHSGVDYPKAATSGFNTRVLETKMAAAIIAHYHKSKLQSKYHDQLTTGSLLTLGKLHDLLFHDWSICKLIEHLRNDIFQNKDHWTCDEFCQRINLTKEIFISLFKVQNQEILIGSDFQDFKLTLLTRCEHVFEEAERVQRFRSICDTTTNTVLLGQLMSQSHASLRDKFQCSHPCLDRLVDAALEAGALGSRLTGAGWGGCVITMVESVKSNTVLERLKELSSFTFMTQPDSGCRVMTLDIE